MESATGRPTPEQPDPEHSAADDVARLDREECPEAASGSDVDSICQRLARGEAATVGDDGTQGSRTNEVDATLDDATLDDDATPDVVRRDDGGETETGTRFGYIVDEETDGAIELLFPNRQEDRLGQWGPYEIQGEVGRGGMGIVFKGFDFVLRRTIAIKVMNPALATSARSRTRFVRESRAMAAISHPNIVAIHAVDEHRGIPYLVMEFVPGEGLDARIRRLGSLPVAEVLRIGAQIADGLEAAHAQGTIHRDIKPANVMLGPGDRVKISDFGLALVVLENSDLTPADHLLGTPSYMAPEQIGGQGSDARADLYSLGCVIHAMAAGRPPFWGKNVVEVARRVCDEPPRPLDEINPDIPRPLVDLVLRLLAKEPGDRVQTAAEIAAALRGMLAGRELEPLNTAPLALRPGKRTTRRRPRRLRLWTVGGLLGGAVLLSAWRLPWSRPWTSTPLGLLSASPAVVDPEPSPVVADPLSLALPDPSAGPMRLVVSAKEPAHFKSLAAAIAHATPGSTINVLEGEYQGPIRIEGTNGPRDLTIEAAAGAVLRAPAESIAVLDVRDAPGVVVRGLTIRCSSKAQHGIRVNGDISGALFERIRVEQVEGAPAAAIHASSGARGSAQAPARFRDLDVDVKGLGIVLGSSMSSDPVSHIQIEDSRIHGSGGKGFLIVLETAVHDTVLSGNILEGGESGVSMALTDVSRPANIEARNNTFYKCVAWINLGYTDAGVTGIDITRNLVLDCDSVVTRTPDLEVVGPIWFRENVWRKSDPRVGLVARSVDAAPVFSTDPQNPDYLRPADPASVTVKDEATGGAVYAGAIPPRPPSPRGVAQEDSHL